MSNRHVTSARCVIHPQSEAADARPPRRHPSLTSSSRSSHLRSSGRIPDFAIKFLLPLLALSLLLSCETPRTRDIAAPAAVRLLDLNPVLAPGQRSVLAASIAASPDRVTTPPRDLTIRLGEEELPARLYWAWTQTPAAARSTWLPPPRRWHLTLDPPPGGAYAAPMIVADIPPFAEADWLQVGDLRVKPTRLTKNGELWQDDLRRPRSFALRLLEIVEPEAEDPTRAWRAALLADHLQSPEHRPRFTDPIVESLARQEIRRWRAALDRLAAADLELARELRRRLTVVCQDDATLVPAWPDDPQQLANLLKIMLAPAYDNATRAALTYAWLAAQPTIIAWSETTGRADRVTVGLANLTNRPLQLRLRWQGSYESPLSLTIEPETITRQRLTPPSDLPARETLRTLSVEAEGHDLRVDFPGPVAARTPGLLLAPFFQPHSLRTWQQGQLLLEFDEEATRASLRRTEVGWELFIECRLRASQTSNARRPETRQDFEDSSAAHDEPRRELLDPALLRAEDLTEEAIYIFVGPVDAPDAVLALTPAGETFMLQSSREGSIPESLVHRDQSRLLWSATIRIPTHWISADGRIVLGLVRSFASDSAPTSFPEPIFPWRVDPGRLIIDLSQWDDLEGARPL